MSRFSKVDSTSNVWARIGLFGPPGSGKTRTATEIATGLCLDMEGTPPIFFIDTEGVGSDFAGRFAKAGGVEVYSAKTHVFAELPLLMKEAVDEGAGCIIIDSISHFWLNIQEQYLADRRRSKLEMSDWKVIKDLWQREFARVYLRIQAHCIICGRESNIYVTQRNDKGKLEFVPKGTKMKAEGETQYEPSLLVRMSLAEKDGKIVNRAAIMKDRSDSIQGKVFDFPTYGDFGPHFKWLNPGGTHKALDDSIVTRKLFSDFDDDEATEGRKRAILIDKIKSELEIAGLGGQSSEAKRTKAKIFKEAFGTGSSVEVFHMGADQLEKGLEKLKGLI